MQPEDIVSRDEADEMVGGSIRYYVRSGRITPWKVLPGRTGAHLFLRSDVDRLRDELRDELTAGLAKLDQSAAS